MKRISINKGWTFAFERDADVYTNYGFAKYGQASGCAARFFCNSNWDKIDLPHDCAAALPKSLTANTFAGARHNTHYHRFMTEGHSDEDKIYNIAWYRREFEFDESWKNKRVFIEFEGVYRDAHVWVNGEYMDRNLSGYTSFTVEIGDQLCDDGKINSIAVRVDTDQPEGWWYEGGGIYRNVNLLIGEPVYFVPYKTVIKAQADGRVEVKAELCNDTDKKTNNTATFEIIDVQGNAVAKANSVACVGAYERGNVCCELFVKDPLLWSIDEPNLYTLRAVCGDVCEERFGFRGIKMDADRGFLLNGKPVKVRGACVHQDFGGVGIALTDNLNRYKISKLKEMGCNAYRSAHHAPSPSLLRACDELGMLVLDETRLFGTSPEALRQLTSLIERDINHPSVFMWCIGNEEEAAQTTDRAADIVAKVSRMIRRLDSTRPITYGANNGPSDIGANSTIEVRGINYIGSPIFSPQWVDAYHEKHPTQPMIATEETSYVASRAGTVNDLGAGRIDYTGDVTMMWATTPKGFVKFYEERSYLAGGFMWTGFDYRGEPNPFYYSNVASSFGTIDLCGMEKPPFYYYKSWWTDERFVKLAPHWNYRNGEIAKITAYTNCDSVTLWLNGRKIAQQTVEKYSKAVFELPFEAGSLMAIASKDGEEFSDELVTAGAPFAVRCVDVVECDNEDDVGIIQLEATDVDGNVCFTASEYVEIQAEGGKVVGVGNGDPSNMDYEQKPTEYEYKYIRSFTKGNEIFWVTERDRNKMKPREDKLVMEQKRQGFEDDFRNIAWFGPARASEPVEYRTTFSGDQKYEYLEIERFGGKAQIYLNGELVGANLVDGQEAKHHQYRPYRFDIDLRDGDNELLIVSNKYEGESAPFSGYVRLARRVDSPWKVRLHYGLARVFVKGKGAKIKAKFI
ncbi:MAG: glycoside hydrolase family 2 protein [Ruminococcaceae bacterium]|nr:glycoside hydrolase family 2 protein [Oscillospiraceae bacterium]